MGSLIRWEPFGDLVSLRDAMDRLFEESFVRPSSRLLAPWGLESLDIDMIESKDEVMVVTSVPGVKPEDIDRAQRGQNRSGLRKRCFNLTHSQAGRGQT